MREQPVRVGDRAFSPPLTATYIAQASRVDARGARQCRDARPPSTKMQVDAAREQRAVALGRSARKSPRQRRDRERVRAGDARPGQTQEFRAGQAFDLQHQRRGAIRILGAAEREAIEGRRVRAIGNERERRRFGSSVIGAPVWKRSHCATSGARGQAARRARPASRSRAASARSRRRRATAAAAASTPPSSGLIAAGPRHRVHHGAEDRLRLARRDRRRPGASALMRHSPRAPA